MATGAIKTGPVSIPEGGTGATDVSGAQSNLGIPSILIGTHTGTTSSVGYISVGNALPSGYTAVSIVANNTNYHTGMVNGNQCQVFDYNNAKVANTSIGVKWIAVKP